MKTLLLVAFFLPAVALGQLRVSADGLYLTGPEGTPVFLSGDAGWALMTALTYQQADTYLADCSAKGINYLQVMLITQKFSTYAPNNAYNVAPFNGPPFTNMNEEYFLHVDSVLNLAASRGIYVMLYPAYLGGDASQGWANQVGGTDANTMREYGRYLGNRYRVFANILWGIGGDIDPTPWQSNLEAMVEGIREYDAVHLISTRDEPGTFAVTHWPNSSWITLNGFYPYWWTFNPEYIYQMARTARSREPKLPCVLQEAWFENEHGSTTVQLRQQAYYTVLGGAIAGAVFGNCPIYHFSQFSGSLCGSGDWVSELSSPGRTSMRWFGSIIRSRNWYKLIPDTNHAVTTAGYGSWGSGDYVTTAYAADSTTIMAYLPSARSVTVDPAILMGPNIHIWWVNPASGEAYDYGEQSKTTRSYTQPGSGDWVLVVDASSMNYPPPGVPVGGVPTAPVLAMPVDGAADVSTNTTLSWNASTGATSYHAQVSADVAFGTTVVDQADISATSYAVSGLSASTVYYWRVSASNTSGSGAYSSQFSFTTLAPAPPPVAPVLATPANGATGVATNPTLTWNASTGATSYRVQVSTDVAFGTSVVDQGNISVTSFALSGLSASTVYYWRVNASNSAGTSAYSGAFSFTTAAASADPVAAYPFDEGAGTTTADMSGHGITGTLSGATWATAGKYNRALSFNGTTAYVDLGNPALLSLTGSATWSAWVYAAANPPDDGIIIGKSDDYTGWQLKTSPDTGPHTFAISISGSAGSHTQRYSTTVRTLNNWYHVAGVYDAIARTLNIYVNGVLNNGVLSGTVPASQLSPALNAYIGRRTPGSWGAFYFNGMIDEVRVYNRALTQVEIQADMNTPLGAPPQPPVAPVLATPANGATGIAINPTLTWNASTGATSYHLQVSTDQAFGTTLVDQANISATSYALSGLSANTLYYWRVSASNTSGAGSYSSPFSFTTLAPPPPPAAPVLATPANGSTGVATNPTLTWNASTGATSYHVQVSTDVAFGTTLVDQANISATSYAVSGLSASTLYYWRVNASNTSGAGSYSSPFSFTTLAPPPPPAAPVLATPVNGATGVATNPTLTWNASTGATSYHLQVSTDQAFGTTLVDQANISATSYALSGLSANTLYYWRVSASNTSGAGSYSSPFSFTTLAPPPPPAAPVLATPANGSTGVATNPTLTWNASTGATSYRVQVSTDVAFGTTLVDQANISATSYAVSGLSASTLYYWRVNASNAGGAGAYSSAWNFTTVATASALVAGYALDEGAGTTTADISGHGYTGTLSGATWAATGKYNKAVSFNGTTGYVDLGNPVLLSLTGSATWSAWVYAAANPPDDGMIIGKSDDNTGWQLKTSPDTGPHTFAISISGSAGSHTQRYSTTVRSLNTWYHVAGVFNATARTLDIYVNGVLNNGVLSGTVPASQVSPALNAYIGRRTPGSWGGFYFNGMIDEVRIYNRALTQGEIQADMNTPLGAPPQPPVAPVLATPANGATGVAVNPTLTWNASTGATSYHVQVSTDVAFGTTLVDQANISATSYGLSSLAANTVYYWRVNASNGGGTSAYTAPFSFATLGPPFLPAIPVLATPANGATGVATNPTLTWNASTGATSYHVQVSTDVTFGTTLVDQANISATSYALSGLSASTLYYWRVNASNGGGTSAYTTPFSFTTAAPPPPQAAPVLATPANGATGVATNPTLTWNASTGATSYHVQVSTDVAFGTTQVDQANISATSHGVSGLSASALYYWRVNASNAGGAGAYSSPWSFTTAAIASGLVAGYAFDEGAGTTTADMSGHGITGTLSGATWATAGKYNKALSFNGTTAYVDLGSPALLSLTGSATWSAWVYAVANPPDDGLIIGKSNNSSGWQLKSSPDTGPHTFGVRVTGSGGARPQRYSRTVRALNTWYHVAGVYDATARTLEIFVNGVLDNGVLSGTVPASQSSPAVNVNIGRRSGGYYFRGVIDEVRVYSRALTQAEIQGDMNTPLGGAQFPPALASASAVDPPIEAKTPTEFTLEQNYPNPFNPETRISFGLPRAGHVTLAVYNVLGERVTQLVDEERPSGFYVERFNASDLPSGVYFVRIVSGDFSAVRKLAFTK